jgi:hypothetical protein
MGVATLVAPGTGAQSPTPAPGPGFEAGEVCRPLDRRYDPDSIRLNGAWVGTDDDGIYYVRHAGDRIWWTGMSGYMGRASQLGREWTNVASGTIDGGGAIAVEWADVPRGDFFAGSGTLALQVTGSRGSEGPMRIRLVGQTGSGFGNALWAPCDPGPWTSSDFVHPFGFHDTIGLGVAAFEPNDEVAVAFPGTVPESGMSIWALAPEAADVCSAPEGATLGSGPSGFIEYLSSIEGLQVSDVTDRTVDGREAVSVDITGLVPNRGCDDVDDGVLLWRADDPEFMAFVGLGDTTRITAFDLDGTTIVLEIWGEHPDLWLPESDVLIELLDFDVTGS